MLRDENWSSMHNIFIKLVLNKDTSIRQAAAYEKGNFAKFTIKKY